MTVGMRLLVRLSRGLPHPRNPSARYLARMRIEPRPAALARLLLGPVPRRVRTSQCTIPATDGTIGVRIYQPWPRTAKILRLVVNFHGGGFVFGNVAQTDWICSQLADRAQCVVASVGYRLAPEHPAPGPYDDCWRSTQWLLQHAGSLGIDPAQASVMGVSAGGNLAALVAIAHRDVCRGDNTVPPLAGQILIYPATDLTLSSPSVSEYADGPILTRAIMDWFGELYLPQGLDNSIAADDPRVSPLLHPDHSALAPALIVLGERDGLRDDGVRYGDALTAAGVPNEVVVYPEMIHGFVSMPRIAPAAHLALATIVSFVRRGHF